jgi:hypothetical protein
VLVLGTLAHVNAAAAQAQRRLDSSLLVLEAAAGQVQVQPSPTDLLSVGGDEAQPDLHLVTRHQRAAGLREHLPVEQPGPKAATAAASATSKVTASSRRATSAP